MQYKTMIFNANQPMVQQITEPLNSEYGIAVKVKKDGEFLPYNQVKVDGKAYSANRDGWACFALTTDSAEGVETVSIEATVAGGEDTGGVSYTTSDEDRPVTLYTEQPTSWSWKNFSDLVVSDGSPLPETITLDARKITGRFSATGTDDYSLSGEFPQRVPNTSNPEGYFPVILFSQAGTENRYVLSKIDGEYTWLKTTDDGFENVGPAITVPTRFEGDDYGEIDLPYIYTDRDLTKGSIDASVNYEISFGTGGEGGSSVIKFPLMVNKRDMGYISPAEDRIQ